MKVSPQPGRAAPQVFPQVVAIVIVLLLLQVDSTSAMRQVDLDYVAPVYLSTFDGYSYGHTFGTDGRISFFYSLPTSSRSEQRTASGEVTGQYAFVAPEGNEFQFRYEADDDGYRVQSDALPVPPQDTDDVKRAKEEFFAAYQKALELAGSDEDYDDYSSSEESQRRSTVIPTCPVRKRRRLRLRREFRGRGPWWLAPPEPGEGKHLRPEVWSP
ncbi:uncharacterized protein [Panulirus ornatus]|uniref:uncharacterized protein n=1 Tax=Panulirus ornatus TaxID=150431 RepID=UPI003A8568FE